METKEKIEKAIKEKRLISFRIVPDLSCVEFKWEGVDNHGLYCIFSSSLKFDDAIEILKSKYFTIKR